MAQFVSRRSILLALGAGPAVLALAACSDNEDAASSGAAPASAAQPASTAVAPESAGTVDMASLLEAGPLPEKVLGKDDAPVTIVEYASTTCGHCASFHVNTYPALKERYIDTGKVRLIMREFPFDPRAEAGFMLARCSGDNYFAMLDVLFKQQQSWAGVQDARAALLQIAKLAGFTQESFEACLTDQKLLDDVRAVRARGAEEFKVDSTPTFFINGNTYKGNLSIESLSAIIDGML